MTWLNPWAWVGLAAIGVPIAIHFLTRAQPRPQPFPTLRFLGVAVTTAMRRRVLRDRALLAVRAAILAAVVAALAQPYVRTAARREAGASTRNRAVVIDTSASLNRPTADGRTALAVARAEADALEPAAAATVRIDAPRLADGLTQAATWLASRGGRSELVVLSDFQRGALGEADVAAVPRTVGIRLVKIDVASASSATAASDEVGDAVWTPHLSLDADRTTVTWTRANAPSVAVAPLRILTGPDAATRVAAGRAAAQAVGVPAESQTHPIAIVLPGAPDAAERLTGAGPIDAPWMFDAIARVREDKAIAAAVAAEGSEGTPDHTTLAPLSIPAQATVLARDASGDPLIAAVGRHDGATDELMFIARSTDELLLTALVHAVRSAAREPATNRELEPASLTAEQLAAWQRPTPETGAPVPDASNVSDGRWLWLAALVLFGVEGWMRRTPVAPAASEVAHARVA